MADQVQATGGSWGVAVRATAVITLLAAAAAVGVVWHSLNSPAAPPASPQAQTERPLRPVVLATRKVEGVSFVAVAGGSVWVTRWNEQHPAAVLRFDVRTLRPQGAPVRIGVPTPNMRLSTGPGGVYVRTHTGLRRIANGHAVTVDPATLPRRVMLPLYGSPGVVADGWVWHAADVDSTRRGLWVNTAWLQRVRATGAARERPILIGQGVPTMALAAAGRIWVAVNRERPRGRLYQVDPSSHRVIGVTMLPRDFVAMHGTYAGGSLWLVGDDQLVRIALRPPAS
ncbi:MAG: hypothetical protein ACTHNU_09935 [Gaiellales bacterium]